MLWRIAAWVVPVLTVRGGAALVEGWKHFENVLVMPDVDLEGRVGGVWCGVAWMVLVLVLPVLLVLLDLIG